jgi:hypothetical protein
MLELQRLALPRQRVVGAAVEHALAAPPHKLPATVAEAGHAVVKATHALAPASGPTLPDVDRATDKLVGALGRIADAFAALAVDDLIEPPAELKSLAQAGAALKDELFPHGTGFVTARSNVEWGALTDTLKGSESAAATTAIKVLHLGPAIAHLAKHVEAYGRALGVGAKPSAPADDAASDAWHTAFTEFAIQVAAHVKDQATRAALLGTYETQLAGQHDELRNERKAHARKAHAAADTAKSAK